MAFKADGRVDMDRGTTGGGDSDIGQDGLQIDAETVTGLVWAEIQTSPASFAIGVVSGIAATMIAASVAIATLMKLKALWDKLNLLQFSGPVSRKRRTSSTNSDLMQKQSESDDL